MRFMRRHFVSHRQSLTFVLVGLLSAFVPTRAFAQNESEAGHTEKVLEQLQRVLENERQLSPETRKAFGDFTEANQNELAKSRRATSANADLLLHIQYADSRAAESPSAAQTGEGTPPWVDVFERLRLYGDLRLRWESDFESQRADGSKRADRDRFRIRTRVGLEFKSNDEFLFNIRLRSGDNNSQQSPHITLWQDPGSAGDQGDVNVDRLWGKWTINETSSLVVGRNGLAIWKPNEMFWDDDVYVDGASFSYTHETEDATWTLNAALAFLPDGDASHSLDERSHVVAGQVVFKKNIEDDSLTLAEALVYIHDNSDEANAVNDDENFLFSYTNAQYVFDSGTETPLSIGADIMVNFMDGPSGDHPQDRFGFTLYARLGRFKKKDDWILGYAFARIEKWAVPRFMAQDDWFRWGSATQTRSSDFYGHELRAGFVIADNVNLLARYYIVESITSVEDGQRFRLDLNITF